MRRTLRRVGFVGGAFFLLKWCVWLAVVIVASFSMSRT